MEIYPSIKDRLNSQHLAIQELIKNLDDDIKLLGLQRE